MSSLTSQVPKYGWQQQTNPPNHNQHLATNRPTQGSPLGSRSQLSTGNTSYPSQDLTSSGNTPNTNEYTSHGGHLHPDGRDSQSSIDFNAQYLTPDQGTDHPFSDSASPSIDEFIWQESFNTQDDLGDLDYNGQLVTNLFADFDPSSDLQGIVPKEISPLLEQPSSSSQPHITSHPAATSTAARQSRTSNTMRTERTKRARASEEDEDLDESTQHPMIDQGHSMRQVVNPTVLVSTYNRGDSPARTALPMARSLSKRSQSSRLSDQGDGGAAQASGSAEAMPATSRLMPPGQSDDGDWDEEEVNDRQGVAPAGRTADMTLSLKDMAEQHKLDQTREVVEIWLTTSEAGTPTGEAEQNPFRNRVRKDRMRSRSTGGRYDRAGVVPANAPPGPGLLVDVDSEDDDSDAGSSYMSGDEQVDQLPESPPTMVETIDPSMEKETSYFPKIPEDVVPEDELEPLPSQFYKKTPWQDPWKYAGHSDSRDQPESSNHAIMQYNQASAKFETASRAATWGTRRRLSDSDMKSILEGTPVRHMSLGDKARDRGNSFINKARGVIRRSSSNVKKSKEHLQKQATPPNEPDKFSILEIDSSHTVTSPIREVQRTFSWETSTSPPITNTGGAFLAMTNQLAAPAISRTSVEPTDRLKSPFSMLKRNRSKSDVHKSPKGSPGLADMMKKHGGPPMPTLASPMQVRNELREPSHTTPAPVSVDDEMDNDNDDMVAIKMELSVQADNIIPNLDGFRTHAKQLNPRLDQYLIERIAQDQLRRYKKLVKSKVDHARNVQLKGQCSSGTFCVELGGKPTILPPRASAKDANVNYAQFKISSGGDSDGEEAPFTEGIVTPALFPKGIPLPPATHLPAEFECPLCFQVKKFQKPSDWTKHVHEDVQPFSCTFPNCSEPKSFKRKADWVRHENERHRHLEWWKCTIQECAHICYRKDNFVQHLVREHKMTEPKAKGHRPSGSRIKPTVRSGQGFGEDVDEFWNIVNRCRHDTTQLPRNESCKFCGNFCNTWKKLSVHVGKHMEQIAMPVLELAAKRMITADTVISPIEPASSRMAQVGMLDTTGLNGTGFGDTLSPYSASGYHSSAGQSPIPVSHQPLYDAGYGTGSMQNSVEQMENHMQQYPGSSGISQTYPYQTSYEMVNAPNYMQMAHNGNAFTQQPTTQGIPAAYHPQQVPRSQPPMNSGYGNLNVDTMHAASFAQNNYYPNSAPGTTYMGGFSNGVGQVERTHSPHIRQVSHSHSPAPLPVPQPNGNEYMYGHHQNTPNGGQYY